MQHITEKVKDTGSKVVYEEAVNAMDLLDAPRDSRVVRNKKYNTVKASNSTDTHKATFADEIQTICAMVPYDDFVQVVSLTHARVPSVILYNDRQLQELKSFCFNKKSGSVWSMDKTYNLGHLYVSVTVYRNVALQRNGTTTVPTFLGPLFIHGNSDFSTYCTRWVRRRDINQEGDRILLQRIVSRRLHPTHQREFQEKCPQGSRN